jgi:hypothetical protein
MRHPRGLLPPSARTYRESPREKTQNDRCCVFQKANQRDSDTNEGWGKRYLQCKSPKLCRRCSNYERSEYREGVMRNPLKNNISSLHLPARISLPLTRCISETFAPPERHLPVAYHSWVGPLWRLGGCRTALVRHHPDSEHPKRPTLPPTEGEYRTWTEDDQRQRTLSSHRIGLNLVPFIIIGVDSHIARKSSILSTCSSRACNF